MKTVAYDSPRRQHQTKADIHMTELFLSNYLIKMATVAEKNI
jgi:hypothetical protein